MLKIGKSYIERSENFVRLCSMVQFGTMERKLWFGVPVEQESALSIDRADPFVMALLPTALRNGVDIQSEDPMSERLHFQIRNELIPVLTREDEQYHRVSLLTPLTTAVFSGEKAVATEFLNNVDSRYTVYRHGKDCEYPLNCLAVFNSGIYGGEDDRKGFQDACHFCEGYARENGFETIFVDSNLCEILPENYSDVATFRCLSFALALQGLISVYLLSANHPFEQFSIVTYHDICFDPLLVTTACTESLQVYLSGGETDRQNKQKGCYKEKKKTDKEIRLSSPYRVGGPSGMRICCDLTFPGKTETAWFEVDEEYAKYLVDDRLDAFVVAYLPTAMRENADLVCEAPISRRLLYQINHYLVPVLSRNINKYHEVCLVADPTDEELPCGGAVGTGWTGGVDCMFTLKNMLNPEEPGHRLTHLLIANSGALESDHNEELLRHLIKRAEDGISKDTGLNIVRVNSNLTDLLREHYLSVMNFRLSACVLALQKLFATYYNSSSYEFHRFCFAEEDSAFFEMFLLPVLSAKNTVFYSSGGAIPRIEKIKELSGFPLAGKYLHPCIYTAGGNCCRCEKCIVTETALYALGTLDHFEKVFDVSAFENNKDWYVGNTIAKKNDLYFGEAYVLIKQKGLITKRSEAIARILCAAQKIVDKNQKELSARLEGRHE